MSKAPVDDDDLDGFGTDDSLISKSQLKREALATRSLAADLLELNASQLQRLPLESDVVLAIQQAAKIRSHGARKRQLQYIAKLMRRSDTTAITAAMEAFHAQARGISAQQHRSEAWRDVLLLKGDTALSSLLELRPDIEAQTLRQLVRNAQRERLAGKPPAASRALFRALREIDARQALPPCP